MDQRLPEPAVTDWRGLCEELANHLQGRKDLECGWPGGDPEQDLLDRARAALAQPEPEVVGAVEQIAQIVYERAMVAAADAASRQHWPSWAELLESDARTHAITTAQAILTSGGYSAWSETETQANTSFRPFADLLYGKSQVASRSEAVGPTDEELLELWQGWNLGWDPQKGMVLMPHPAEYARAVLTRWGRAGLADGPAVPEGREPASVVGEPSDEELLRIAAEAIDPYDKIGLGEYEAETECAVEAYGSELIAFARAVLARWGHQPAPPAAGEVGELVAWLRDRAESTSLAHNALRITRAADLLEQRHPAPVPVTERLPGPEDCDGEGRCWLFSKVEKEWRLIDAGNPGVPHLKYCFSHWLPAHALPLPSGEVEA